MSLYDMNPLDDEEERKRREQELIADRMDAEAYGNPVGPVNPSFMDTAGQYLSNRFDQAKANLTQAGNTLMNPQQAIQQRMAGEQQQAQQEEQANTEVQTQTTKQYADGSKEHIVKTQEPAGQPAQAQQGPMGPVAPNTPEAKQQADQFAQAMAQYQKPQAAPAPAARSMPQPQQQQLPTGAMPQPNYSLASGQGQPGIRMPQGPVSPQAGQVAAAPGASLAQMGAQAQATPYTPTAEREVAQPAPWVQAANDAGSDLSKLLDVAAKHPESRDMILEKTKLAIQSKTKEDEAKKLFADAEKGDLKSWNRIQQMMKPESGKAKEEVTVGDYVKAYMYNRLGLTALSQDIQNKIIGKETKFGQVTVNGSNWQVETDPAGNIIRAKDEDGTIATEATLNKLRANATKAGTHAYGFTGESATIPQGQPDAGQEYRQRTNAISGAVENIITTGPNAGNTYKGPPGAAKSVGTSYSKALNQAFIDFQSKPSIEMAKKMMEIAGQVDDGSGSTINAVNNRIRQMTPDIFGQITSGQAGTPPAPTGVGGGFTDPSIKVISGNRTADAQQQLWDASVAAGTPGRLPNGNPVAKPGTSKHETGNAIDVDSKSLTPAGRRELAEKGYYQPLANDPNHWELLPGKTSTATSSPASAGGSLASRLTTQNKIAGEVGEDLGKIQANQPKAEQNADYLLTKINELVTHPGFSVSVGASVQPGFQFIPGTDKASWYQRFEEVKGQSFLQGIENLRGMGALSNQEGEAATKAVQRMSTSQSEAEFKAAAKDFNEVIQRGIDRNRMKLGQPPLYGTAPASEIAKQAENKPAKLSADDRKAIDWARQNPDDPRAKQIKQRLGL